jgi:hypothetical protein
VPPTQTPTNEGLAAEISGPDSTVDLGSTFDLRLTVRNLDNFPVTGVTGQYSSSNFGLEEDPGCVEGDLFPATLQANDGAAGGADELTCTVQIAVSYEAFLQGGDTFRAIFSSSGGDPVDSETFGVSYDFEGPLVTAALTADRAVAQLGQTVTFTIAIQNQTLATISSSGEDPFGIEFYLVSGTEEYMPSLSCLQGGFPVSIGSLVLAPDNDAPGGSDEAVCTTTWVVNEDDVATQEIRTSGTVYLGPIGGYGLGQLKVAIGEFGQLSVQLTSTSTDVEPGDVMTFTAVIKNISPDYSVTGVEAYEDWWGTFSGDDCYGNGNTSTLVTTLTPNDEQPGGTDELECSFDRPIGWWEILEGGFTARVTVTADHLSAVYSNEIEVTVPPAGPTTVEIAASSSETSALVGTPLTFTVTVRNTGANPLFATGLNLGVSDAEPVENQCLLNGETATTLGAGGVLAPNDNVDGSGADEWTCTYERFTTIEDRDDGSVTIQPSLDTVQGTFTADPLSIPVAPGGADLQIDTSVSSQSVSVGQPVTYTATFRNIGTIPVTVSYFFDDLFLDEDYVCANSSGPIAGLTDLVLSPNDSTPNSGTDEMSCSADYEPTTYDAEEGLFNTIYAETSIGSLEEAYPDVTVDAPDVPLVPDLYATATGERLGDVITVTVSVRNAGSDPATNFAIVVENGNGGPEPASTCSGDRTFPLTLAADDESTGGMDEISCVFTHVIDTHDLDNGATSLSFYADATEIDEEWIDDVQLSASEDVLPDAHPLAVSVSVGQSTAAPGDTVQYAISIHNTASYAFSRWGGWQWYVFVGNDSAICPGVQDGNFAYVEFAPDDGAPGGADEIVCTFDYQIPSGAGDPYLFTPNIRVLTYPFGEISVSAPPVGVGTGVAVLSLTAQEEETWVGATVHYVLKARNPSVLPVTLDTGWDIQANFDDSSCTTSAGAAPFPIVLAADDETDGSGPDEISCSFTRAVGPEWEGAEVLQNQAWLFNEAYGLTFTSNILAIDLVPPPPPDTELEVELAPATQSAFPGDDPTLLLTIRNVGDLPATGLDALYLLPSSAGSVECSEPETELPSSLAANDDNEGGLDEFSCLISYHVTNNDLSAGSVSIQVAVSSVSALTASSNTAQINVSSAGTPSVEITFTVDKTTAEIGDLLLYTGTIHNNSPALVSATATSSFLVYFYTWGPSLEPTCAFADSLGTPVDLDEVELAPDDGEAGGSDELVCTYLYTVTADDASHGSASGQMDVYPGNASHRQSDPVLTLVPTSGGSLSAVLAIGSGAPSIGDAEVVVGETVHFTATVQNVDEVAVSGIEGQDALGFLFNSEDCQVAGANTPFPVTLNPEGTGAPDSDTLICEYDYTVTQQDFVNGEIANAFRVSWTGGNSATSNIVVLTVVEPQAHLAVTVVPSLTSAHVGDTVTFQYTIVNDGDVTLTGFFGYSSLKGGQLTSSGCGNYVPTVLEPGGDVICSASYVITEDDLTRGYYEHLVYAYATEIGENVEVRPRVSVVSAGPQI